ncbi:MAG: class II aldolase/adducin family protein [bacterium]|nr:class II aldolase/adducin family protein [bacterium]
MNWHQRNQFQELIRQLISVGKWLSQKNFVAATDGNLSVRFDEYFLATQTGVALGRLEPTNILPVDKNGNPITSPFHLWLNAQAKVTSEWKMHSEIYQKRPDINAVIHAHSPYATAWSITQKDFPVTYLPETAIFIKKVRTVPFAVPGSTNLANLVSDALMDSNVVLLSNHGIVTVGSTLLLAYDKLERVENAIKIVMKALLLGQAKELTPQQIQAMNQSITESDS